MIEEKKGKERGKDVLVYSYEYCIYTRLDRHRDYTIEEAQEACSNGWMDGWNSISFKKNAGGCRTFFIFYFSSSKVDNKSLEYQESGCFESESLILF